jgi:antitoxin (DNA-binding transcriptional repressor) of toxin-antitoxin stability system
MIIYPVSAMISMSVTEASLHFVDLVNQVCTGDEEALLNEDGRPVVRLIRVPSSPATGKRLAAIWPRMAHLVPAESADFESDLALARSRVKPPATLWE